MKHSMIKSKKHQIGKNRKIELSWEKEDYPAPTPAPASDEVEKPEPTPCTMIGCDYYDTEFDNNCLLDGAQFEGCEMRNAEPKEKPTANPAPANNTEEKHQQNIVLANDNRRLKKLQICLEERDNALIDWIDMMAAENRRDRNGQILTMLENMMLRDMEAA